MSIAPIVLSNDGTANVNGAAGDVLAMADMLLPDPKYEGCPVQIQFCQPWSPNAKGRSGEGKDERYVDWTKPWRASDQIDLELYVSLEC